jgi:hypothetical protein
MDFGGWGESLAEICADRGDERKKPPCPHSGGWVVREIMGSRFVAKQYFE